MTDPTVLRCWIRPREGAPPEAAERLVLEADRGVVGDHTFGRMRHVTLVFEDDWNDAAAELGREVDPAGRRANVLLSGRGGLALVGRELRLGSARIAIRGETKPCPVMDRAAPGMMAALRPGGRAGVWGRVIAGGEVRPGDRLEA